MSGGPPDRPGRRGGRTPSERLRGERGAQTDLERQRAFTGRLVAQAIGAEERERRRLAKSLHDGPVQDLHAAQLELRAQAKTDGVDLEEPLAAISRAIKGLRDLLLALYPPTLEGIGLAPTIEQVASDAAQRHTIAVHTDVDREAGGSHEGVLLSLARELIGNAARHARATGVWVRLFRLQDEIVFEVEDDGVGLTDERRRAAVHEGHIGLALSAERVEALGGSFDLAAGPAGGTIARVGLPARRARDHDRDSADAPTPPVSMERRALNP